MNKPIFESKEEFEKFLIDISIGSWDVNVSKYGVQEISIKTTAGYAKELGYIK